MKRNIMLGAAGLAAVLAATAGPVASQVSGQAPGVPPQLAWAYGLPYAPVPAVKDDGTLYRLPGAKGAYTRDQVAGRDIHKVPLGPADWFPAAHPVMPKVVAEGDNPLPGNRACALCHLPTGRGRPENAPVRGLPKAYIVEQLQALRAGERHSADPGKTNVGLMADIASHLTDDQIEAAATYFSSMPWTPWVRVVESPTAPKVRSDAGLYIPLTGPDAGAEPIAGRIVEVAQDPERAELRDPRSGFIAYVPPGAVARGRALVTTGGGRTLPCAACHGPTLSGMDTIPGIAGRSPSYVARQLNDIRQGARRGGRTDMMQPVTANLTPENITDIAAYLASRTATAPSPSPSPKG